MSIRIIITGGTFDKRYDEIRGELSFENTHLTDILKQVRCRLPLHLEICLLKDSLDMVEDDRKKILEACAQAEETAIVITHGTDTMVETARLLGEAGLPGKVIVLTGAMVPYSVTGSDAIFNFGCAISAVQLLKAGVYIVMNGRQFNWDQVRKNREKGYFEALC